MKPNALCVYRTFKMNLCSIQYDMDWVGIKYNCIVVVVQHNRDGTIYNWSADYILRCQTYITLLFCLRSTQCKVFSASQMQFMRLPQFLYNEFDGMDTLSLFYFFFFAFTEGMVNSYVHLDTLELS